jgi:hypothetical protein
MASAKPSAFSGFGFRLMSGFFVGFKQAVVTEAPPAKRI